MVVRPDVEWLGVRFEVPMEVTDDRHPEPYAPVAIVFAARGGEEILQVRLAHPSEIPEKVADFFRATIASPDVGEPHAPGAVRIACAECVEVLRATIHPATGTRMICAPTPELDATAGRMANAIRVALESDAPGSWLRGGLSPASVRRFFEAAAAFHRAKAWDLLGRDEIRIDIGHAELADWVVVPSSPGAGFLLSPRPPRTERIIFLLGTKHETSSVARMQIDLHGWEVAAPSAYPRGGYVAPSGEYLALSAKQLAMLEATLRALATIAQEHKRSA